MRFNSFDYILVFLPVLLLAYLFTRTSKLRNPIIVVASYLFYAWGNWWLTALLFSSSIVDYVVGEKIHLNNLELEKNHDDLIWQKINSKRKRLLFCSLIFNLGLLMIFKYWDWLTDVFFLTYKSHIILDLRPFKHNLAVPPGISFYTFQTLSYTIDIYRRKFRPEGNLFDYMCFVSFFPQLIAGPIERAGNLLPQLVRIRRPISSKRAESAVFVICWGLFKKVVLADNLGHLIDRCREGIASPGVGFILVLAFAFQIYCDFSAYSDIARGTAQLFGIKLRRNFLMPYFALNPSQFWKKWHISLSSWIRDYVYIPLGGSRHSLLRNMVTVMLTMFLVGLWHGAGKFFVLWGLYHGSLLIFYRLVPLDEFFKKIFGPRFGQLPAIITMFGLALFGWLLFWVKTDQEYYLVSQSFFKVYYLITQPHIIPHRTYELLYGLAVFTLPVIIAEVITFFYRRREFVDMYYYMGYVTKTLLYVGMFYGALFFASRGNYDFIYFQF